MTTDRTPDASGRPGGTTRPSSGERHAGVLQDLRDEADALDAVVAAIASADWWLETPAVGWNIGHQIGHLTLTDDLMHLAVTDPEGFPNRPRGGRIAPDQTDARDDPEAGAKLLADWRRARTRLIDDFAAAGAGARMPWLGPPMSVTTAASSRLMEIWAHGQDVLDTLHLDRIPTRRLRHIAHIAVATRDWSFTNRGLEPPDEPIRVEVAGIDDGEVWAWGPEDAPQRVEGPALDFALLATRRIRPEDADVHATGPDAERWLGVIQTFAGPPGPDPAPRSAA